MRVLKAIARLFCRDESGAVLAETLIVLPFVTLFSVGILEFGNMFWEKEQVEAGLRDAARYLGRCQVATSFGAACSQTIARNIAFYGNPAGTGPRRVPGWGPTASVITITPNTVLPTTTVIRASTSYTYKSSPLFGWLHIGPVTMQAYHDERYLGW
jgi:Flp pilus assembly protein TadG